jgi:hypothetical protein
VFGVRILVHGRADAVPATAVEQPVRPGRRLDGVGDVAEALAGCGCFDRLVERLSSDADEAYGRVVDRADRHRHGRVAVVSVDDRPAVDGEDVALFQGRVVRDAVHDDVVDRQAQRRRVRRGREAGVVVQEGRLGAVLLDARRADRLQLGQGDARLDRFGHPPQRHADDVPRLAHEVQLGLVLESHHG